MWAIEIWASEPWPPNSCAKNSSSARPITISGVTIGSSSSVSDVPRARRPIRTSPSPSSVPRMTDPMTANVATWSVRNSASRRSSLANSRGYQSSVKPRHAKLRRESLNENRMRITIGANRNA